MYVRLQVLIKLSFTFFDQRVQTPLVLVQNAVLKRSKAVAQGENSRKLKG